MHPYAVNSQEREKVSIGIVIISIALALAINKVFAGLNITIPWWLDTPSVVGVYGLLYTAFNHWIWHWPLLRKLGIVSFGDLSGKWTGKVISWWNGNTTEHDVVVKIRQTWTNICIGLETEHSTSKSIAGAIFSDHPIGTTIVYTYLNEAKPSAKDTMHSHRGTAWLTIKDNGRKLDGEYYTGRDRRSTGVITLQREGPCD